MERGGGRKRTTCVIRVHRKKQKKAKRARRVGHAKIISATKLKRNGRKVFMWVAHIERDKRRKRRRGPDKSVATLIIKICILPLPSSR